jgi:O-antigen/teichoic acid export membrane protein
MFVAIMLIPVVTRYLSPQEAGIWFSFQGLVSMIALLDLGFGFAISRQAAFVMGANEKTEFKDDFIPLHHGWHGVAQLFLLTRQLYRWLALAAGLLAICSFEVFSRWGHLMPNDARGVRWSWYAISAATVILILAAGQSAFLNGLGAVYQTRFLAGMYQLISGMGAAIMAMSGAGLLGMGGSYFIAALVYWMIISFTRGRTCRPMSNILPTAPPAGSLAKLAKAALPVGGVNVFGSLVYTIQTPLVGMMLGPSQVTPFYLAQKISTAITTLSMQTALPQIPFFTRLLARGERLGAVINMNKTILRTTILVLCGTLFFFLLSPCASHFLLHRENYVSSLMLALMSLDMMLMGMTVIWGHYVLASGINPFFKSTILTGLMSLCFSVFLVQRYGVIGLPLATLIAGCIFNYRINLREGIRLKRRLQRP